MDNPGDGTLIGVRWYNRRSPRVYHRVIVYGHDDLAAVMAFAESIFSLSPGDDEGAVWYWPIQEDS